MSRKEKWYYNNRQLECVSGFNYVGLYYTPTMSMYKMAEFSAVKAKKVLNFLLGNILNAPGLNTVSFFKIFDSKVSPIMLYGSELWGTEIMTSIEAVHIYACKRFLNASENACNTAVMGDIGRYPIYISASCRCIKYWLKLLECSTDRYIRLCYDMLKVYDNLGYVNWATNVRLNLYKNGFGYIWESQCVVDKEIFLCDYKQRLKDQYIQM